MPTIKQPASLPTIPLAGGNTPALLSTIPLVEGNASASPTPQKNEETVDIRILRDEWGEGEKRLQKGRILMDVPLTKEILSKIEQGKVERYYPKEEK